MGESIFNELNHILNKIDNIKTDIFDDMLKNFEIEFLSNKSIQKNK